MIKEAWNDINNFSDSKKINYDTLTIIQKKIIDCDYDAVLELINLGEKNYHINILCNGYYQKKYNNIHPTNCHDFVCYRTIMYYALWINAYYYSEIFTVILQIMNTSNVFLFTHSEDIRNDKYKNISDKIKSLYNLIISTRCVCCTSNEYKILYDDNSFDFKLINDGLPKILEILIIELEKLCGDNNDIIDCECEMTIKCHKENIKNIYLYDNKINDIDLKYIFLCIGKLKGYIRKYEKSAEIVKLLFSQQAIEYYYYNVLIKSFKLNEILNIFNLNKFIDINYIWNNDNIFSITITQQNKSELIIKIREMNGELPKDMTVYDVLNKCHIDNIKKMIKMMPLNFLGNIDALTKIILEYDKMLSADKIELIYILLQRGVYDENFVF